MSADAKPEAMTGQPSTSSSATPAPEEVASGKMSRLVLDLVRPYRGWLVVVFAAMVVETAMSLAGPWPLKIVIDNVLGTHPLP